MQAVIQRVLSAELSILASDTGDKKASDAKYAPYSSIAAGILALVAIEKEDTKDNADKLLKSLLNLRIFADSNDRMNLSLLDVRGDLMLVSQFTLAAATHKGNKPSFSAAAEPGHALELFNYLVEQAKAQQGGHEEHEEHGKDKEQAAAKQGGQDERDEHERLFGRLATGKFAADMQISLTNDGPVTFILKR